KARKRGARKGHKGNRRELLPPDEVDKFVDHFPDACESCWRALPPTPDPEATRYQLTEVPPIKPHTTEHRRHAVACPHCRYVTRAPYDAQVIPASPLGPRLVALIALFTGVYHLSRRKTQSLLSDVLGVHVSLGGISRAEARVSKAIQPAVDEAWERAVEGDVKHMDGTSWLQSGTAMALWTFATTAVTVFKILANGTKKTLATLFRECEGIMVSDRATALTFWAMDMRQICWAHLLRKYTWFSERDGPAGKLGEELLELTGILFEYWRDRRDGKLTRERYRAWMAPLQKQMEALLEKGSALGIKGVSGSCADILAHREALWTFVEREDVEPTNNHAERELRAFVLWRKRSFGTQSDRGNRFAERAMTIAHTARKQQSNVLAFLTACCEACESSAPPPSLFETAG
ncbi:MAG: IS66 family transposase, partial [Myxococcales bacterium]|nr:IS66 family transposase [Myxococcales bacterium]